MKTCLTAVEDNQNQESSDQEYSEFLVQSWVHDLNSSTKFN